MQTKDKMNIVYWVVSGLLMLVFVLAGVTKLIGMEFHLKSFAHWGYPAWFMFIIGFSELLGAVMVIIPTIRFYGATLLVGIMSGAILTHIVMQEYTSLVVPVPLILMSGFIAWTHREAFLQHLTGHSRMVHHH